jgi:hypothetical protein
MEKIEKEGQIVSSNLWFMRQFIGTSFSSQ